MTKRLPHPETARSQAAQSEPTGSPPLRSDALSNRERILAAAREVFADAGLNAPMREVARHAEVGPATLYRHFPTKQALATGAFATQAHACHAIVEQGLAEPDPWHGFRLVVEQICELHARNRGFTEAFMATFPDAADFATDRKYALTSLAGLARRAQAAGRLRPDFVLDDLILVLMANNGIQATSIPTRVAASRRFAALAIEAFRASPGQSPLPPTARPTAGRQDTPLSRRQHTASARQAHDPRG